MTRVSAIPEAAPRSEDTQRLQKLLLAPRTLSDQKLLLARGHLPFQKLLLAARTLPPIEHRRSKSPRSPLLVRDFGS